jgi:hypothetical protein
LRAGIGSGQLPHFDVWMIEMLREPRYGLDFVLSQGLRRTMRGLGPVGLMGVATAVLTPWIGRPRGTAPNLLTPVLLAFAGYWILWAVVMNNQYSAHHFMTMIALPFAALGSGLLGELLLPKVRMAATVLAIVTAVAVAATGSEKPSGIHLVELGQLIDASLPRDAVVITSQRSGVPLYYSHRIVVRSLDTDAWIADHRDEFRAICRSCPVYLAISDSETVNFQRVIQGKQRVAEQAPWGIYWIAGPEDPVWGSRQAAMAAPQAGAQGTP